MEENVVSYLIACESILVDNITSRPTLVGIFDILVIPKGQEKLLYSFMVGGKIFSSGGGELNVKIKILGPDNKLFRYVDLRNNVGKGDVDIRSVFPLVEFTLSGRYMLKIEVNGKECDDDNKYYFEVLKL